MGYWSIVIPEDTKNYVINPSFEKGLTNHTAFGAGAGTRTRVYSWQKRGIYSLQVVCTVAPYGNVYSDSAIAPLADFVAGDVVTFSADINVTAGTLRLVAELTGAMTNQTLNIAAPFEGRISISTPALTGTPTGIVFYTYFAAGAGTAYVDGLQVERKAYRTSYCDGDLDGHYWLGTPHGSLSARQSQKSNGGRIYDLNDLGYYVVQSSGIGMPPIRVARQAQALLPGELIKNYHIEPRTIELHATPMPTSQANLHSLRKDLIDALRPDRFETLKPFLLRYSGAHTSKVAEIPVIYDAGMEYNHPADRGYYEDISLRLFAPYPLWSESGDAAFALNTLKTLAAQVNILGEEEGIWTKLGTDLAGATTEVHVIKIYNGLVYVGGIFDSAGGAANTKSIAVWNPATNAWASVGGGATGAGPGGVDDMAFDAAGNLYAVGGFAAMNAVASTQYIAKWDGTNWTSITPGAVPDSTIDAIAISRAGLIVVTGQFTNIGGTAAVRIARYNGSAWSAYGSGLNASGSCLAFDANDVLYVGGGFTSANLVTVNRITYWNGTTFVSMNSGLFDGSVTAMAFHPDGTLWIGGSFTLPTSGGGFLNRVAYWNGIFWQSTGDGSSANAGVGGSVSALKVTADGNIIVGGVFGSAGGNANIKFVALWNGYQWLPFDAVLNSTCQALDFDTNGNFYVGHNGTTDVYTSEITTITYSGTVETYPVFTIKQLTVGTATVKWIENLESGAIVYLNHTLQLGETLTVDLRQGRRKVESSTYGSTWKSILQSTSLGEFTIKPGSNRLKVLVEVAGGATVECFVKVKNVHWSMDGVAV